MTGLQPTAGRNSGGHGPSAERPMGGSALRRWLQFVGFAAGALAMTVPLTASTAAPPVKATKSGPLAPGDHRVRVNGVSIAYHVAGSGPLLVVLSPDWGIGSGYLRAGLQPLQDDRTVVYVDERGSGQSGRPDDPRRMSYDDMAQDVEALRSIWAQPRLDLVGHSAGATIAMDYASEHPDHVRQLVLIDAELPGFDSSAPRARFRQRWLKDPAHAEALRHYGDAMPKTDAEFSQYLHHTIGWYFSDPARNAAGFAAAIPPRLPVWTLAASSKADHVQARRGTIKLERIRSSATLILVGEDDAECPVEMAEAIKARIAGSQLTAFERSGHFPWVEARDAFFTSLRGFLAKDHG